MAKVSWWRYVVSVILFVLLYFLAPLLIYAVQVLTQLTIPKYYRSSPDWLILASYAVSMLIAGGLAHGLTKERRPIFCIVLCVIAGLYTAVIAIGNHMSGLMNYEAWLGIIGKLAGVVVAIIYIARNKKTD